MVWKPHVTVAAIIEDNGRFLMVEEEDNGRVVYNQPAGHLEPEESLIEAVVRETREETAWPFEPQALTGIYRWIHSNDKTFLRFAFCGQQGEAPSQEPIDKDILRVLWLNLEELQKLEQQSRLRSPLVMQCVIDYQQGHRFPLSCLQDKAW